ncbi:MAG: AzlC family ABC transporter permease [Acidobacteria bacterium]|nr:AzlC family ABC transporter permease [Acidobacteriota bacterium]
MNTEVSRGAVWLEGATRVLPLLIGVFPFALIAGSTAISVGLTPWEAIGFSLFIFAGASQLAALELMGSHAPIYVVIVTAWIINLRMLIYSAAMAPHFRHLTLRWRSLVAYLLTDQAFVLASLRFEDEPRAPHKRYYYLGAAMGLWITWQIGSALGIVLGARIPQDWSLDFAIPLTFIALMVPALKDRVAVAASLSAGLSVLLLAWMPMNLGFIAAIAVGVVVGLLVEGGRS